MEKDPGFWRFFAYLNLFIFAMLVLVLGDNLPVLFVGWEGVGLCSYLLIGFWYEELPNAAAGKKAFIANRIGDFGMLVGMFLLLHYTGALDWAGIASGSRSLVSTVGRACASTSGRSAAASSATSAPSRCTCSSRTTRVTISAATGVGLALFLGCTGKSAQIPLYVWLPDAMAGPTPVSALIHAATMVTAGVYLVCRLSFVFVLSPFTMMVIAVTGAATALFAATIALVQNDIKKVLAYSTVSQLGFMFLGVGVGAFTAGFFHVFTHAFFKACLFLGAGSVIHAMHARIHDGDKSQDMRIMGGLRKYMPLTYWTFLASTLAIAGCPLTSGFFSKDEILYRAFVDHTVNPFTDAARKSGSGALGAADVDRPDALRRRRPRRDDDRVLHVPRALPDLLGDFRGWTIGRPSILAAPRGRARRRPRRTTTTTRKTSPTPGYAPHESPWQMTVPLIILGTFAIFAGVLNMAPFHFEPMSKWLDPVFESALKGSVVLERQNAEHLVWPLAVGGHRRVRVGTGVAYWMYIARAGEPAKAARRGGAGPLQARSSTSGASTSSTRSPSSRWSTRSPTRSRRSIRPSSTASSRASRRSSSSASGRCSARSRTASSTSTRVHGRRPRGDGVVLRRPPRRRHGQRDAADGDYSVPASPGMGYAYRWDANGDGKPDDARHSGVSSKSRSTSTPGQSQKVRLEVTNAFGLHGMKEIPITRPAAPQVLEIGQS